MQFPLTFGVVSNTTEEQEANLLEQLVFYLLAALSLVAALSVVVQRKAVYSALSLIVCFFTVALLFYQLGAVFIAAIQVIVYAGAIMVLFLFVVMLIDPESEIFALKKTANMTMVALPLAALFGFVLFSAISEMSRPSDVSSEVIFKGDIHSIAGVLFSDYLLPFEVTSILIIVAVLGAMVLAKRTD